MGTAFPQSVQCEGGTHHSKGLCLDAGHRPLVSKSGVWGRPHKAFWAGIQMPFALLLPSGKTVGGAEASGVEVEAWPAEQTVRVITLHPCCTVKGHEGRDNPAWLTMGPGQGFWAFFVFCFQLYSEMIHLAHLQSGRSHQIHLFIAPQVGIA